MLGGFADAQAVREACCRGHSAGRLLRLRWHCHAGRLTAQQPCVAQVCAMVRITLHERALLDATPIHLLLPLRLAAGAPQVRSGRSLSAVWQLVFSSIEWLDGSCNALLRRRMCTSGKSSLERALRPVAGPRSQGSDVLETCKLPR